MSNTVTFQNSTFVALIFAVFGGLFMMGMSGEYDFYLWILGAVATFYAFRPHGVRSFHGQKTAIVFQIIAIGIWILMFWANWGNFSWDDIGV